jgi:hypothetical protein
MLGLFAFAIGGHSCAWFLALASNSCDYLPVISERCCSGPGVQEPVLLFQDRVDWAFFGVVIRFSLLLRGISVRVVHFCIIIAW